MFNFKLPNDFPKCNYTNLHPQQQCMRVPIFPPHICQPLVFSVFSYFLIYFSLFQCSFTFSHYTVYVVSHWVLIYLMINDVEPSSSDSLFLFEILISSLVNCPFKNWIVCFLTKLWGFFMCYGSKTSTVYVFCKNFS